jgi:AcrR family transcriptional regulator
VTGPVRSRGGRPRDPGVDDRILEAVIDILGTERLHHFTMQDIADRAGAGKAALYRRWPDLSHLIAEALERMVAPPVEFLTGPGSLRVDLLALVTATVTGREAAAVVGILGELGVDPILRDAYLRGPRLRLFSGMQEVALRASARQDPEPDLCTVLAAVAYLQWSALVSGREPTADDIAGVVDAVITATACRSGDG